MIQGENFGEIKNSGSIDMGCCRTLFWDTLQQHCVAGGITLVNASNCYDYVVHNVASLAAKKWG
eukprot:9647282-Ditylum_brightwellii.AAC.1